MKKRPGNYLDGKKKKNEGSREDFSFFPLCFSLFFVPLHQLCEKSLAGACGGIGRRARLRIWYLAMCRFESCQAHKRKSA